MGALLGGGNKEAKKQAEISRQQQSIANDRQLAELRANDQRTGAMRRNPRGRRLFSDDSKSTLS